MHKTVELKSGKLELNSLRNGKLVTALYRGAKTGRHELVKGLKQAGVVAGFNETCLNLLVSGKAGELPVAKAFISEEPARVRYKFESQPTLTELQKLVSGGGELPDGMIHVTRGQKLVEVVQPPQSVIRYPDGRIEALNQELAADISAYCGTGTVCNKDNTIIFAEIDGIASRSSFGYVSVFAVETIKSAGKAHGAIYYESALMVEADIRSEADVTTLSSMAVNGIIRAARLDIKGNLTAGFGMDNPRQLDTAVGSVGQSVYTSAIRNYKLWAGQNIFTRNNIDSSQLQCLNSIVSPMIKKSDLRAGGKVIAGQIGPECRIYLGRYFLKDEQTDTLRKYHAQHEKRLVEIGIEVDFIRENLKAEQSNSLRQIGKLKRISPQMIPKDSLLNRSYTNQVQSLKALRKKVAEYEKQYRLVEHDNLRFAQYEKQFLDNQPQELQVWGRVAAGTIVHSANQTLKIEQEMGPTRFRIDPLTGKIQVEKLAS